MATFRRDHSGFGNLVLSQGGCDMKRLIRFIRHQVNAVLLAIYTVCKPVYIAVAIVILLPFYVMAITPMAGMVSFLQFEEGMPISFAWIGLSGLA